MPQDLTRTIVKEMETPSGRRGKGRTLGTEAEAPIV